MAVDQKASIRELLGDAPLEARRREELDEGHDMAPRDGTERDMAMDPNEQANSAAPDPARNGADYPGGNQSDGGYERDQMDGGTSSVSRTDLEDDGSSSVTGTRELSTADLAASAGPATMERGTSARDSDPNTWESGGAPGAGDRMRSGETAPSGDRNLMRDRDSDGSRLDGAPATSAAAPSTGTTTGTASAGAAGTGSAGTSSSDRSTPLFPESEATQFRDRWLDLQAGFVDEPRDTVQKADGLVAEVIQRLAQSFADERSSLEGQWSRGQEVSTEDLRQALRRYRSFFDRLLSL